ncbi:uncharacterized protein LTR77_006196 [Saxophila tyrrhenica]|uniref:Uncharacterized protein n=1 Tax=Saxophila tyrrhenica TaxID=1690608 RepID=A0AAV9PB49_9PEZI|nr:hypothetical protein LTR77_006196 [Saxophila tyrrhenica]
MAWRLLLSFFLSLTCALQVSAQTGASATISTPPPTSSVPADNGTTGGGSTPTGGSTSATDSAPDVYLNVPKLHVGRIELDVENLSADINLNANVAQLVKINAGVQLGISKVNITIADVDAELDLIVRLGNLVEIVGRVFESLDLNPLLINTINGVTGLLDDVIGEVDGLLGSITQGGKTLSFLVDNLGNIVQEVGGVSSIVGNYAQNMTLVADSAKDLGQGLTQKTFSYGPLDALVNIVFNKAGQIVQAAVEKTAKGSSSGGGSASASAVPSSAAASASAAR